MKITEVNEKNYKQFSFCGYKNPKRPGYNEKTNWVLEQLPKGLKLWMLHSDKDGTQGMLEAMPGEQCWRPIEAKNYMVIHCLFVGFKKIFKDKGYATKMIEACEAYAKKKKMKGVAVVVRKGSFMASETIFLKRQYQVIEELAPDFKLLAKPFSSTAKLPQFGSQFKKLPAKWKQGLVIFRADQCPYTITNVKEMVDIAKQEFKITAKVIEIKTAKEAQASPCPFGTFGILYNGKIILENPTSATRFKGVLKKILQPS